MKFKDYYSILGVSETATDDEIKRAYRKKVRLYHPDVSKEPDAEARIKEVNEAYEALRDEKRRAEYDQLKRQGYRQGDEFRRPHDWQRSGNFDPSSFGGGQFGDFFETIFGASAGSGGFGNGGFGQGADFGQRGGHGRRPIPTKGKDVSLRVSVDIEQAFHGGKSTVKIPAGDGQATKTLSVSIPAGVIDGKLLRIRGQGRPGNRGGRAGDLLLTVRLKAHQHFVADGADITTEVSVTPLEAIDGVKVEVPTLAGEVVLAIPPNTRSGTKMRLRGRGLTSKNDQYVMVQVALPNKLTSRARQLLMDFQAEAGLEPREESGAAKKASV